MGFSTAPEITKLTVEIPADRVIITAMGSIGGNVSKTALLDFKANAAQPLTGLAKSHDTSGGPWRHNEANTSKYLLPILLDASG